jgi:hypothetical protein
MMRFGTMVLGVALWLACGGTSHAFSLLGPLQAWQTEDIGYDRPGDIGGPRRPNEGFRWNLPVITYAFDQSFVAYFGPNGMRAVDQAMKVFNDLPPMSRILDDGTSLYVNGVPVPTRTTLVNQDAVALGLLDVKSTAMRLVIEELGLTQPERFAWALRGRDVDTLPNPDITNYAIINLNFDPITLSPTPIVNEIAYGYIIQETQNPDVADAYEYPLNPLDIFSFTSVAGGVSLFSFAITNQGTALLLQSGRFYTGLTHDDVGGLRWLYHPRNMAVENLETNVVFGTPVAGRGGSPWQPFFVSTNTLIGTNFLLNTNVLVREALRGGINELRFQRVNFDSLLGRTFVPITNRYLDTFITNGQATIQPVQRVITQPDIVFRVEDLGLDIDLDPFLSARSGTGGWINNDAINGTDLELDEGPGVIVGPVFITFTDLLPVFFNDTTRPGSFFLPDDTGHTRSIIWGSFDETSTPPILYPQYGNITLQQLRQFAVGGGN